MIQLGGNITLEGFQERDYAELIIVKKIVGRYARELSDTQTTFQGLTVGLAQGGDGFTISAAILLGKERKEEIATASNLFVALDTALKGLL